MCLLSVSPAGLSAFCPPLNFQGGTLRRSSAKVYWTGAQTPPTSCEPHPPTQRPRPLLAWPRPSPGCQGESAGAGGPSTERFPASSARLPRAGSPAVPALAEAPLPPAHRGRPRLGASWKSGTAGNLSPLKTCDLGRLPGLQPLQEDEKSSIPASEKRQPAAQEFPSQKGPSDSRGGKAAASLLTALGSCRGKEGKRRLRHLRAFSTLRGFACHKSAKFGGLGPGRSLWPGWVVGLRGRGPRRENRIWTQRGRGLIAGGRGLVGCCPGQAGISSQCCPEIPWGSKAPRVNSLCPTGSPSNQSILYPMGTELSKMYMLTVVVAFSHRQSKIQI